MTENVVNYTPIGVTPAGWLDGVREILGAGLPADLQTRLLTRMCDLYEKPRAVVMEAGSTREPTAAEYAEHLQRAWMGKPHKRDQDPFTPSEIREHGEKLRAERIERVASILASGS
jgi:hypothetical protein